MISSDLGVAGRTPLPLKIFFITIAQRLICCQLFQVTEYIFYVKCDERLSRSFERGFAWVTIQKDRSGCNVENECIVRRQEAIVVAWSWRDSEGAKWLHLECILEQHLLELLLEWEEKGNQGWFPGFLMINLVASRYLSLSKEHWSKKEAGGESASLEFSFRRVKFKMPVRQGKWRCWRDSWVFKSGSLGKHQG